MNSTDVHPVARRGCFGILAELKDRLAGEGLTDEDVWNYVKNYYKADSRKKLTRTAWTELVTRLAETQNNPQAFDNLVRRVWRFNYGSVTEKTQKKLI